MKLLQLTCDEPAMNLAVDEALLDEAESGDLDDEVLRIWEPAEPLVVVGRSCRVEVEVNRAECDRRGIPIFRRCSGGGTVIAGRGCLMYAVVLRFAERSHLRMIEQTHSFVLQTLIPAIERLGPRVTQRGISDLAVGDRKVSGNSLRCRRDHLLYHGTLLYDFPLELVPACLGAPMREPDYRGGRPHGQFVMNLPVAGDQLREAIIEAWQPQGELTQWPEKRARQLIADRYAKADWNFRL